MFYPGVKWDQVKCCGGKMSKDQKATFDRSDRYFSSLCRNIKGVYYWLKFVWEINSISQF